MQTLRLYIKPETELISIKDSFMLDLSIYPNDPPVDDEAANDSFFDENTDDEYDSFFDE